MPQKMTLNQEAVLTALCYGQVFKFPLKLEEFALYIPFEKVSSQVLKQTLQQLIERQLVIQQGDLYALISEPHLFANRSEKEPLLEEKWSLIRKHLPRLFGHRFIKGVLLTGSMAAKNPDGAADADLLLILNEKRLWIGYLWIRLWCKLNKKGHFCPNYVLGHHHLELSFPNYFTAVEYAMSVPLKWDEAWLRMEDNNAWLSKMLPNAAPFRERRQDLHARSSLRSKLLDLLIFSPLGWVLDQLEWWRLQAKTRGLYTPNRWVYKPHSPHRQQQIFGKLLTAMDAIGIEFTQFRQHIKQALTHLEKAEREWSVTESTSKNKSTDPPIQKVYS